MKLLIALFVLLAANAGWTAEKSAPPQAAVVKGEVLEVKDVTSYTYLRLKTKDGETWAAVNRTPVKKGAEVTIENAMVMNNFESSELKKTFPKIIFGTLGIAGTSTAGAANNMTAAHSGLGKAAEAGDVKVAKASGADARTVAEIVNQRTSLRSKTVVVRAKVVKYTPEVMGKNWVHVRDGSGSAADDTNDLLVTTKDKTKVGDVVLVKGIVHTDKDLGSGYSYKVLVEEATLQP